MATDEFVIAMNSQPAKQFVGVDRAEYDTVRQALLETLLVHGPILVTQLAALVEAQLQRDFDRPLRSYYTMVKLDMEACGEIRRVPGSKPEIIELSP